MPQVDVLVEFEMSECTRPPCRQVFEIRIFETSIVDSLKAKKTRQYGAARVIHPTNETATVFLNASLSISLETNFSGFYLALIDAGTCISVNRILVSYYKCPEMTRNLLRYPETIAPPYGSRGLARKVIGECVDGASGERDFVLSCYPGGVWGAGQLGTACHCDKGRVTSEGMESCIGESEEESKCYFVFLLNVHLMGMPYGILPLHLGD